MLDQAFQLGLALGIWDIPKMLQEMPYDLFVYWISFLAIHESKTTKRDYQFAYMTKSVQQVMAKHGQPIDNYLIKFRTPQEVEDEKEAEMDKAFEWLSRMPGATVK